MNVRARTGVPRGEVGLGDLLRALAVLDVHDGWTRHAVAALLGLDLATDEAPTTALAAADVGDTHTGSAVDAEPSDHDLDEPVDLGLHRLPDALPTTRSADTRDEVRDQTGVPGSPEALLEIADDELPRLICIAAAHEPMAALPVGLAPVEEVHLRPPPHVPLLDPRRERATVAALATVWNPRGDVDTTVLVERSARGTPLRGLPRRLRGTTAPEVVLLLDVSAGMAPFRRDETRLVQAMRGTVGRAAVRVRLFRDCPSHGLDAVAGEQLSPLPALPGTPVVVVTHLGLSGPGGYREKSRVQDWLDVARDAASNGNPLVALVPWPLDEVPSEFRAAMRVVTWDRPTGPRDVIRVIRRTRFVDG